MARPSVSLCFLVWNERRGCELDIPRIDFRFFDEVFAIDGGSTDGTVAVLESFGVPVHRQQRPGLNNAYWEAAEVSRCENIVVYFPKGTLPVETVYRFQSFFEQGKSLVIASRLAAGGRNEEDSQFWRPRKWGVKGLALVAALLWRREGPMVWDVLHGVKGFSVEAFKSMNPTRGGLSIDLEMVIRAYRQRWTRQEFPVVETARVGQGSHFKILPTARKLLRYLWYEIRRPAFDAPIRGTTPTGQRLESCAKLPESDSSTKR